MRRLRHFPQSFSARPLSVREWRQKKKRSPPPCRKLPHLPLRLFSLSSSGQEKTQLPPRLLSGAALPAKERALRAPRCPGKRPPAAPAPLLHGVRPCVQPSAAPYAPYRPSSPAPWPFLRFRARQGSGMCPEHVPPSALHAVFFTLPPPEAVPPPRSDIHPRGRGNAPHAFSAVPAAWFCGCR